MNATEHLLTVLGKVRELGTARQWLTEGLCVLAGAAVLGLLYLIF